MTERHRAAYKAIAQRHAVQKGRLIGQLNAALDRMDEAEHKAATAEDMTEYWEAQREYKAAAQRAADICKRAAANAATRKATR